jgi:hypothetical protein
MGKKSKRELPEYDDEKCLLCGENFADTWTEIQIQELEEQRKLHPMSDVIRLCFACYNRLDARLPYRASLN